MLNDIRYAELRFLQDLASNPPGQRFNYHDPAKPAASQVSARIYYEIILTLLEELYVSTSDRNVRLLLGRLRGEVGHELPPTIPHRQWIDPRDSLENLLMGQIILPLHLTYRGMRRIEELRYLLSRDRILEPFKVLLSMQYFRRDLEEALRLGSDVSVSVLYADMDHFKNINTKHGQSAGDVVMEAYLVAVRDSLGTFGEAYRGVGDEVAIIIKGQGHSRAIEFAEKIRERVAALRCTYRDQALPNVSASIGVATSPPEKRSMDLEDIAEDRKRKAKEEGRNRVISS